MRSRYDKMRPSTVEDIDGQQFPDPLTIDYQSAIRNYGVLPGIHEITPLDLKKLWLMWYRETGKTDLDDILYSINGVEHVGVLEPGDQLYMYDPEQVDSFKFKDLEQ